MSGAGSFFSGLAGGASAGLGIKERRKDREAQNARTDALQASADRKQTERGIYYDGLERGFEAAGKMGGGSGGGGGYDFGADSDVIRDGIVETANALGVDPEYVATAISYETAGTFNPQKRGPTTQWGQHEGFIQFGQPQQKEYGVDLSSKEAAIRSQLGADGAIVRYMKKAGVKPGMGMLDIYSAINAGRVGRYNASDANNGGAPGTVADKVNSQMAGHRAKALALLGRSSGTAPAKPAPNPRGVIPATTSGEEILRRFYKKQGA